MRWVGWFAAVAAAAGCAAVAPLSPYRVDGDAIRSPLTAAPGDAIRGREIVSSRDTNCLLCHSVPGAGVRFMGNLGPPLAGVATRFTAAQLRLRIVDSMKLNPETIMPSYYRMDGLNQVGEAWRGRPILTALQVEDAVAYLVTLR